MRKGRVSYSQQLVQEVCAHKGKSAIAADNNMGHATNTTASLLFFRQAVLREWVPTSDSHIVKTKGLSTMSGSISAAAIDAAALIEWI